MKILNGVYFSLRAKIARRNRGLSVGYQKQEVEEQATKESSKIYNKAMSCADREGCSFNSLLKKVEGAMIAADMGYRNGLKWYPSFVNALGNIDTFGISPSRLIDCLENPEVKSRVHQQVWIAAYSQAVLNLVEEFKAKI